MEISFSRVGNPSEYHIIMHDDGMSWDLRLIHSKTSNIVDVIDLDGYIRNIDPALLDHIVISSVFNPSDWNTQDPEVLKRIQEFSNSKNIPFRDFICKHNEDEDKYNQMLIKYHQNLETGLMNGDMANEFNDSQSSYWFD